MDVTANSPERREDRPASATATASRVQPIRPLPFTNGLLKRHNPLNHDNNHDNLSSAVNTAVVSYKECLKNHAASLGTHALDGCGEFIPSPSSTFSDPTSLKCAACGCHRNFHRREPEEPIFPAPTTQVIEYQPHHRHHPPPPPQPLNRSPNSPSPPPISSSYYPSAPHMLLALSSGLSAPQPEPGNMFSGARKRCRTRFSLDQKEKMQQFAERVGWRMQKKDEELVHEFCNEIGVEKGVLKVWMHNNKSSSSKKDVNGGMNSLKLAENDNNFIGNLNRYDEDERVHSAINGSSSSS